MSNELSDLKPLVLDEYPVNDDSGSINVYMYEGDDVATVAITNHHSSYDQDEAQEALDAAGSDETADPIIAIDTYWNLDDLHAVALSCARALAAAGGDGTKILAALVSDTAEVLAASLV